MTTPILPDDRRQMTTRLTILQVVVAGAFILLAVGFWIFQVPEGKKFAEMAENNHMRRLPLPAPRGVLFDRNGKVLVENRNTFNIALVREQTKNLDETLHVLAMATGVDEAQLRETVNRRRREPSYRPIVLIENATLEQVAAYRLRQWELPGIIHQEVPARKYPESELAAHLFGYVSEISETQLTRAEYTGVEPGTMIGQAGVEQAYNKLLMGADGDRFVVVNSVGREIREVREQPPKEGQRAAADDRRRCAAGDRGRLHGVGLQRCGCRARPQDRRSARILEPACLRSQRLRGRRRSRHVGVAQHRRSEAAAESGAPGPVLSRAPPSRWR